MLNLDDNIIFANDVFILSLDILSYLNCFIVNDVNKKLIKNLNDLESTSMTSLHNLLSYVTELNINSNVKVGLMSDITKQINEIQNLIRKHIFELKKQGYKDREYTKELLENVISYINVVIANTLSIIEKSKDQTDYKNMNNINYIFVKNMTRKIFDSSYEMLYQLEINLGRILYHKNNFPHEPYFDSYDDIIDDCIKALVDMETELKVSLNKLILDVGELNINQDIKFKIMLDIIELLQKAPNLIRKNISRLRKSKEERILPDIEYMKELFGKLISYNIITIGNTLFILQQKITKEDLENMKNLENNQLIKAITPKTKKFNFLKFLKGNHNKANQR